jgi:hypothetical protein
MHGQDGPGHDASQGQVSAARRFGKPAEDVEDVRLRSTRLYSATVAPGGLPPSRQFCPSTRASQPCRTGRTGRCWIFAARRFWYLELDRSTSVEKRSKPGCVVEEVPEDVLMAQTDLYLIFRQAANLERYMPCRMTSGHSLAHAARGYSGNPVSFGGVNRRFPTIAPAIPDTPGFGSSIWSISPHEPDHCMMVSLAPPVRRGAVLF